MSVATATGTEPELISTADAEQLVNQARSAATDIGEQIDALMELIQEIRDREVAKVLGYKSWPALLMHIFEGSPFRVDADNRRKLVNILVNEIGLSTRVVAPIVGAGSSTVARDAAATAAVPEPEPEAATVPSGTVEDSDTSSTDSDDTPLATVTPIDKPTKPKTRTGADGRTRKTPAPKPAAKPTPPAPATALTKIQEFSEMLDTTTDFTDAERAALVEVQEKLITILTVPEVKPDPVVGQIETEPLIMIPRTITKQALADGKTADNSWTPKVDLRKTVTRSRKITVKAFDLALATLVEKGIVIASDDGNDVRVKAHHSDDKVETPTDPIKLFTKDLKFWPIIVKLSGKPELLTEMMRVNKVSAPGVVELLNTYVYEYRLLVRSGDTWKLSTNAGRVTDFAEKPLRTVRAV